MAAQTVQEQAFRSLRPLEHMANGNPGFLDTHNRGRQYKDFLKSLYAHPKENSTMYIFQHDNAGIPFRRLEAPETGVPVELIFTNEWKASDWSSVNRPVNWTGTWPPSSVDDMLTPCDTNDECSFCCTRGNCQCQYTDWLSAIPDSSAIIHVKRINADGSQGIFAARNIKSGEVLGEYIGVVKPNSRGGAGSEFCASIDLGAEVSEGQTPSRAFIDATEKGSLWRFLQPADEPNIEVIQSRVGTTRQILCVWAIKDIKKGEKLTEMNWDDESDVSAGDSDGVNPPEMSDRSNTNDDDVDMHDLDGERCIGTGDTSLGPSSSDKFNPEISAPVERDFVVNTFAVDELDHLGEHRSEHQDSDNLKPSNWQDTDEQQQVGDEYFFDRFVADDPDIHGYAFMM